MWQIVHEQVLIRKVLSISGIQSASCIAIRSCSQGPHIRRCGSREALPLLRLSTGPHNRTHMYRVCNVHARTPSHASKNGYYTGIYDDGLGWRVSPLMGSFTGAKFGWDPKSEHLRSSSWAGARIYILYLPHDCFSRLQLCRLKRPALRSDADVLVFM